MSQDKDGLKKKHRKIALWVGLWTILGGAVVGAIVGGVYSTRYDNTKTITSKTTSSHNDNSGNTSGNSNSDKNKTTSSSSSNSNKKDKVSSSTPVPNKKTDDTIPSAPFVNSSSTIYYYNPYEVSAETNNNNASYDIQGKIAVTNPNNDKVVISSNSSLWITYYYTSSTSVTYSINTSNFTSNQWNTLNSQDITFTIKLYSSDDTLISTTNEIYTLSELNLFPTFTNTLDADNTPTIIYNTATQQITSNNFNLIWKTPTNVPSIATYMGNL